MRLPERLSQDSVFDFLSSTGLPLVSRLASVVRAVAIGLASASLGYGLFALLWWPDSFWSPYLPWSGALPSLASAPLYFRAWQQASRRRMQSAAQYLFGALFLLSILATWHRGAFCPAWYMQPFLALLATSSIGVVPGLSLTLVAVVALLLSAIVLPADAAVAAALPDVWTHTMSLAAVTLASALTGAVLHKLFLSALAAAEVQRRKIFDSRRALRHRERLLRHALRVETVGDLAGLVSHQLRNAYQVMMGHISLGEMGDDQERLHHLEQVGKMLQDSRPLLDQLMGLAHPDEGEATTVDLEALAHEFHARANRLMPATVAIELECCGHPLVAHLNPRGLEHALWNLVINARHAIEGRGTIRLVTELRGQQVAISVTDDGCGMPEDIRQRIFDPYFTTKPPGKGTGLGLVAVDRFVRGSKGSIEVETAIERGTTFRLVFPLHSVPQSLPAASA